MPKGWKLVPETPTSKQIVHMACQIKGADADGWFRTDGDDWPEHVDAAERAYKWALSEAPQPAALAEWLAAQAQPVAFAKDGVLFWHGEHASWRGFNGDLYLAAQAQPVVNQQMTTAASDVLADTQRQIIEAAERRGYERGLAECTQDREDSERYRWLLDKSVLQWYFTSQEKDINAWVVMHRHNRRVSSHNGADLDAAIDADRAAAEIGRRME